MTATVLYNCQIYVDGFDYTGHANSLELSVETDDQDLTVFGTNGWKARAAGLKDCSAKADVFWEAAATGDDAVDSELFGKLGSVNFPVTLTPSSTETDAAYLFKGASFAHSLLGDVGDLSMTNLELTSSDTQGLIRGQLAKSRGTVSATGALGSGCSLGLLTSTKYLYSTFHVFSAGTTITVVIESDDNSGFTSAVTRATIGPITTRTGTYLTRVAGPVATDTFWRFRVTAITGTFNVAGAIAIQ